MLRLPKLTTPATAAAVAVPDKVPPAGFVPIATLTFPVKPAAVLPWASWAVTCTAGVMTEPAVVVVGSAEKTRCDAAPGVMLNAVLVAPAGPVALAASVYPVPTLSILTFANVATPLTAAMLVGPASVPPPGLAAIASATLPLNGVAVLPCASCAVTWTAGVIAAPEVALDGWTVNTSSAAVPVVLPGCTANTRWVAPPAETLNAALVGDVSPVAAAVRV